MLIRKRFARKGVSETVAAMLMLLVVISLSAVMFGIASNGFGNFSNGLSNLFSNTGDSLSERIVIEQVTFNESGGALGANVYVRNVGSNTLTVSAVYVTDVTTGAFITSRSVSSNTLQVTQFLNIAVTFTPTSGHTYSFNVATQRGNTVLANAKA